jgi:hypothetical protein
MLCVLGSPETKTQFWVLVNWEDPLDHSSQVLTQKVGLGRPNSIRCQTSKLWSENCWIPNFVLRLYTQQYTAVRKLHLFSFSSENTRSHLSRNSVTLSIEYHFQKFSTDLQRTKLIKYFKIIIKHDSLFIYVLYEQPRNTTAITTTANGTTTYLLLLLTLISY